MQTRIFKADELTEPGEIIRRGGLVAFPTETVYGLGANAFDAAAALKIFAAKRRPPDNPLIVHIAEVDEIDSLCHDIPAEARILADAFWPGPLTMIMPKRELIPPEVSAGLDTVGIRFPSNPIAQGLIRAAGVPIAAPSANLSGKPSTTSFAHVFADMNGRVDGIIDGGESEVGVESTVIEFDHGLVRILRPGYITVEDIESVLGQGSVEVAPGVTQKLEPTGPVRSPGMKYRHYAPQAQVIAVCGEPRDVAREILRGVRGKQGAAVIICGEYVDKMPCEAISVGPAGDYAAEAHTLFDALRALDRPDVSVIYAQCPPERGVGLAVANRLKRAAAFNVIDALRHRVIGLTGPTGAGKGVVSAAFRAAGAEVIDCDSLYHEMLAENGELCAAIKKEFPSAFTPELDRRLLGREVFSSPEKLKLLNKTVHPYIAERILAYIRALEGSAPVVLDAPTLLESGLDSICDTTVAVLADGIMRKQRISLRDSLDPAYAELRVAASKPDKFYSSHCNRVLYNNTTLEAFQQQARGYVRETIQEE